MCDGSILISYDITDNYEYRDSILQICKGLFDIRRIKTASEA